MARAQSRVNAAECNTAGLQQLTVMEEAPPPGVSLTSGFVHQPPRLTNQVLLRELHLDDNSISSLLGLSACWLPLMQHLSVAKNR